MTGDTGMGPGSRIGDRYLVDATLGTGGMSTVYRATDEALGRTVAIKVFTATTADPTTVQRQRSEVQLIASFAHPALVTLFDAVLDVDEDRETEQAYLVMQYIDGPTLGGVSSAGPVPEQRAALIGADIADALAYVHDKGIIHRDVKPANILVPITPGTSQPNAFLADFGIARFIDGLSLTATGSVLGTASFLSPEQALGRPLSPATDVYSLGLTLIQATSTEPPFPGTGMEAVAARLGRDPFIAGTLSADFAELLREMTARGPEERPDAAAVAVRLRALSTSAAVSAPIEPTVAASLATVPVATEPVATEPVATEPAATDTHGEPLTELAPTAAMPEAYAPTIMLPALSADEPTVVLPRSEPAAAEPVTTRTSRRGLIVGVLVAAVVIALLAIGTAIAVPLIAPAAAPETSSTPTPSATNESTTAPVATTDPTRTPTPPPTPTPTGTIGLGTGDDTGPGTGPGANTGDDGPGKGNGNGHGKGNGKP